MTLSELGAKLRQAREERETPLSDVADRLKIPLRILRELEEGSDSVPKTVYTLHFIKEYARLLRVDEEEISQWLKELKGFENAVFHPTDGRLPYTPVRPSIVPALLGSILKVILVGVLIFGAYEAYIYFFTSRLSESVPPPAPVDQGASPWIEPAPKIPAGEIAADPAPALPSNPKENDASITSEAPVLPPESAPEILKEPAAPEPPAENSPSTEAPLEEIAEPAPTLPAESPALPEGMHQVEVLAVDGDCWMGFEPDGKHQQRTLRRGDTFSMTFRESLVIRLGNIQAVLIRYDGKELERNTSSRVVTLSFPPQP